MLDGQKRQVLESDHGQRPNVIFIAGRADYDKKRWDRRERLNDGYKCNYGTEKHMVPLQQLHQNPVSED